VIFCSLFSEFVSVGEAYALAGRFDEAIPPLRQYLRRYPKFLLPHLALVRVYSELGNAAEGAGGGGRGLADQPQVLTGN
jgi:predicted Zn-dependent protease